MNKEIKVGELKHQYEKEFVPTQEYLDSMPDIQNSGFIGKPIDFVGVHNIRLPFKIREKSGDIQEVMVSVTGMVSLEAQKRGINMSRIGRSLNKSKDEIFDINKVEEVLRNYQKDLDTFDAHILMNFKYRMWQDALKSRKDDGEPEGGWQYYNVTFDCNLDVDGVFTKIMHVDYVYSSACPCSTALSEHAASERGLYGIPHSQRSIARVSMVVDDLVWIEDVIETCRKAVPTEVLVFCKRADEQDFAVLNGSCPVFVEDAVRKFANEVDQLKHVVDYKIILSHRESLHYQDAIAVITKGVKNSIFNHHVTLGEWQSMTV